MVDAANRSIWPRWHGPFRRGEPKYTSQAGALATQSFVDFWESFFPHFGFSFCSGAHEALRRKTTSKADLFPPGLSLELFSGTRLLYPRIYSKSAFHFPRCPSLLRCERVPARYPACLAEPEQWRGGGGGVWRGVADDDDASPFSDLFGFY